MRSILKTVNLGDIGLRFDIDTDSGAVALLIYPLTVDVPLACKATIKIDSLIQAKLVGDDYPKGFLHGKSMRNSGTTQSMKFNKQCICTDNNITTVITELIDVKGNIYQHNVQHITNGKYIRIWSTFLNTQSQVEKLEMLSSFSLSGFSPWDEELMPGSLWLSRFRSKWTMEGREEYRRIEDFQLESCWKPSGGSCVKFGQLGSMPVRGFFPAVILEDQIRKVAWAVQLELSSSWQLEVWCKEKEIAISGGIADRDYGHWMKYVNPGELFTAPSAIISVCEGNRYDASQRLISAPFTSPKPEHSITDNNHLPIIFNDFCTNWGRPSESQVLAISKKLKGKGIDVYVIDAGWYDDSEVGWPLSHGDWEVSPQLFPAGMKVTVDAIHKSGLKAGIWFEFETCGRHSESFSNSHKLLHRDGFPLTVGDRRFLDMRLPEVKSNLQNKVINFLKNNNFDYLKIDYNENIGAGIDFEESSAEGVRQVIENTHMFIKHIKSEIPNLIIENCASGGHRLDASSRCLADMSSFSDAHETISIPIVAANLHFLIHPSTSLIWAVVRKNDSPQRIYYSLCAAFLGLICLSGDINQIDKSQWKQVEDGIAFYRSLENIIITGSSYRYGNEIISYDKPSGYQILLRIDDNTTEAMVIFHSFDITQYPDGILTSIPLPEGTWNINNKFSNDKINFSLINNEIFIETKESFNGAAIKIINNLTSM